MTEQMSSYPTDIYVVSQTARELTVIDPSSSSSIIAGVVTGLLFTLIALGTLLFLRNTGRSIHPLLWLLPLVGVPFLALALLASVTTRITLSADAGTLSVRKTLLSVPISSQEYPLAQVRLVKVGVGDVCRFLYVSLADKPAANLTGCTDRTGYNEVAQAMNSFLDANRR
ncbi:MAG: hypothetical protein JWQ42_2524 [Edaphobacter sp.]|nr:hypothetical protein [Edaphobacter sp.]